MLPDKQSLYANKFLLVNLGAYLSASSFKEEKETKQENLLSDVSLVKLKCVEICVAARGPWWG